MSPVYVQGIEYFYMLLNVLIVTLTPERKQAVYFMLIKFY